MATGDVYMVKDKQRQGSEPVLNVYWYRQVAGSDGAQALAQAFEDDVVDQVISIQNEAVEHVSVEVINPDSTTDFAEVFYSTPIQGILGGSVMPAFVSWTFKLIRTDRSTRNGRKAIAGVNEDWTAGNIPVPSQLTALEAVAAQMAANVQDFNGNEWEPIIYGAPTDPPSSLPLRINPVADVAFSHLSTQNTRKIF